MNKPEMIIKAIRHDLLLETSIGVEAGGHVFGAVVLDKATLSPVIAGSNNRMENPIYHGEVETLRRFFACPNHPKPKDCIFVASHDPCSMCISAIAWAGFDEVWVLFNYEDVKKSFGMPVDLLMYKEIFGAEGARPQNAFFKKYDLKAEAAKEENAEQLAASISEIEALYAQIGKQVRDFDYPGM